MKAKLEMHQTKTVKAQTSVLCLSTCKYYFLKGNFGILILLADSKWDRTE